MAWNFKGKDVVSMDTVMKTDMIVIGIFIAVTVLVVAIFVTVMLMDRYKKKRKTERSNGVMTEQEKEELRRRIEARKRREAAGTVNNNQQTCSGCRSVIPANYDVCPICGEVLRQGVKPKQQIQSNNSDKGQGGLSGNR